MFIDDDLVGDKSTRHIQLGSHIHWYSKRQSNVKEINFRQYFCSIKTGVEIVEAVNYKINFLESQYMDLITCYVITGPSKRIKSHGSIS